MAARHICLVFVLIVAAGCGGSGNAAPPDGAAGLLGVARPTPTPLATEPQGLVPVPLVVTPKPAAKSGSYYKPPGWDGVSDVDCKDFDTHDHAESFFKGTGGSTTSDPYRLDSDHDGSACETLP